MNNYAKDPLLIVSVLLGITGAVQANTGLLSRFAEQYPTAFGLAMTLISCLTGALTAYRTALLNRGSGLPPAEQ